MSTEQNKAVAMRTVEAINAGDMSLFESLLAPDAVEHAVPPGMPPTRETAKQFVTMLRAAFPDSHYHVDDVIAEGDRVVQRVTCHGTMKGEFLGMPATGKSATWTEMHIVRVANGKIVEHWANVDQLGMLQQLGLAPAPGG
ncbi:MAG: ester cyclase [Chloroflexota bacterium]